MWKPLLYLDASIFDVLHLSNHKMVESRAHSLALLSKCKDHKMFKGYVSPFLFHELGQRFNDLTYLYDLLETNDISYITFNLSNEIDYLADGYLQNNASNNVLAYDYFHIASCAYLNLEYFVTWDRKRLNNFETENKVKRAQRLFFTNASCRVVNPAFLVGKEHTESLEEFLKPALLKKEEITKLLNTIVLGKRTATIEDLTKSNLDEINKRSISVIDAPSEKMRRTVNLIPHYEDTPLQFEVRNYEKEINLKQFPLLEDENVNLVNSCMHHYMLYHFKVKSGSDLLKIKLQESNRAYQVSFYDRKVTKEELDESADVLKSNKLVFLNWLLPQLLASIYKESPELEGGGEYYKMLNYDFKEIDFSSIDQAIFQSFITDGNIRSLKEMILSFVDFLTRNCWTNYRGFLINFEWTEFMKSMINNSMILISKDNKEIWFFYVGIDCG